MKASVPKLFGCPGAGGSHRFLNLQHRRIAPSSVLGSAGSVSSSCSLRPYSIAGIAPNLAPWILRLRSRSRSCAVQNHTTPPPSPPTPHILSSPFPFPDLALSSSSSPLAKPSGTDRSRSGKRPHLLQKSATDPVFSSSPHLSCSYGASLTSDADSAKHPVGGHCSDDRAGSLTKPGAD